MQGKFLFRVAVVLSLLTFTSAAQAQFTIVEHASVRTGDKIMFSIRLERQSILLGQDIRVHYQVDNHSRRTIYLVKKDETEFQVIDNYRTIEILPPYPSPIGHGGFDFKFTKIAPQTRHRGSILISGKLPDRDGLWSINMGFAYIKNIAGLVPKPPSGTDPAPWRGLLYSRMEGVSVGKLTVQTKKSMPLQ